LEDFGRFFEDFGFFFGNPWNAQIFLENFGTFLGGFWKLSWKILELFFAE